jgi:hypothetical protein
VNIEQQPRDVQAADKSIVEVEIMRNGKPKSSVKANRLEAGTTVSWLNWIEATLHSCGFKSFPKIMRLAMVRY